MTTDDISFVRSDTPTLTVTILDNDNAAFDLTAYTARFTVKENRLDTNSDALIGPLTMTIAAPATGIATLTLTTSQTDIIGGEYWYDIEVNNGTSYHTVTGPSKCTIVEDVTK